MCFFFPGTFCTIKITKPTKHGLTPIGHAHPMLSPPFAFSPCNPPLHQLPLIPLKTLRCVGFIGSGPQLIWCVCIVTTAHFLPATYALCRSPYLPHKPSGYGLRTQHPPLSRFPPLKSSFLMTGAYLCHLPNNSPYPQLPKRHVIAHTLIQYSTPRAPPYFNHAFTHSLLLYFLA